MNLLRKLIRNLVDFLNKDIKKFTSENNLFDVKLLDYNYSIFNIFEKIKTVPGHIVELGVGTGRNSVLFSYLIKKNKKDHNIKYFGYDLFENCAITDTPGKFDTIFKNSNSAEENFSNVKNLLKLYSLDEIAVLIKGDITSEIYNFQNLNIGFRNNKPLISLIYIDCNTYEVAMVALRHLKQFLSPGAYICTDELH